MRLLIFGMGYAAGRIAGRLSERGWRIAATTRDGRGETIAFDDHERVRFEAANATHILSSVPPGDAGDPVLDSYGALLGRPSLAYLSSTGVYGDTGGGWVDESGEIAGRRANRNAADAEWLARGARVFRLPGIYGPSRSPLERVVTGQAHRTGIADQVFSRVHVDDIAAGVALGMDAPAGAYNLADDHPCANDVIVEFAARLLGLPSPPVVPIETLSPAARAFYAENRRVANGKAKRVLGWRPLYPDYRFGLRALSAMISPASASNAPTTASVDQR